MSIKLNDLAVTRRLVSAPGNFAAVAAFCDEYGSTGASDAVIATMNAAMLQGLDEFYSPIFPRGARFNTASEVHEANLDVQYVRVTPANPTEQPELIVTGHAGTKELLVEQFPSAVVVEGNVTAEQVVGKVVAGTLPPHLVAATKAYVMASIRDFDYAKDGDLAGDELRERLVTNSAVSVTAE